MRLVISLMAAFFAAVASMSAVAVTLITAQNRVDMVHDAQRGIVYVTDGTDVLRYQTSTATLLPPLSLGGDLGGIDLSPDGNTLVVADRDGSATQAWVYLVALDSLTVRRVAVSKSDSYEGGIFTAAYGADNNVYTTSTFNGSGWVPLRQLVPATEQWTTLASVRQDTMLAPSGDAQTIAFAESNISDGRWGLIDIPTGQIVHRTGYTDGTGWFNFEIATDRFGTQFALPTYDGTFVYNDTYQNIATLGQYAGQLPIGVAYHPVEQIAYFPWTGTSQVRVYDMTTYTQIGEYDFGNTFSWVGNSAFQQGRTRLSRDGSLIMVTVNGGVGLETQYAPLAAAPVFASTNQRLPVDISLQGSIGNNGSLNYDISSAPAHGAATVTGATATYTPAADFYGQDVFTYRAHYGRATADAQVTVNVINTNTVPVAVNDYAVASKSPVLIPVLANDSDADGDLLNIVALTQPPKGSASIQDSQILYTPPPNGLSGAVTFTYSISDGRGGVASATVFVSKARH